MHKLLAYTFTLCVILTSIIFPDNILVDDIIIKGNQSVPDTEILSKLMVRPNLAFEINKLNRSIKNLKSLKLFKEINYEFKNKEGKKVLILNLIENPKVTAIEFNGNQVFSSEQLLKHSSILINEPKNTKDIRSTIQKIEKLYDDNNFIDCKIYKVESPTEIAGPVVLFIAESTITKVSVTGNIKTQDYVILRESELVPGDLLQKNKIKRTIRQVYNLGFFEDVQPDFIETSNGKYEFIIKVVEKESQASVSGGAGYSAQSGLSINADINWQNIYGSGQQLMLKGTTALGKKNSQGKSDTYQFKFHNPWAFDKRKSFTFRTWLMRGDLNFQNLGNGSNGFRNEIRGGYDMTFGWPHPYDFYSTHTVKFEGVDIQEITKSYELFSYTYALYLDRRDEAIHPKTGYHHSIKIERSIRLNSQMLKFIKINSTFKNYYKITKKQVFATKFELGYLSSPDISRKRDIYLTEYFQAGGSYTVRGYDDYDPFSFGNKLAIATAEYRFLFTKTFSFILFYDIGNATEDNIFDFKQYKSGKGFGIRLDIAPLGPIRLDLGFDENNNSQVHFNIGHAF